MLPASRRQQRAGRPFHPTRARFAIPGVAAKVHDWLRCLESVLHFRAAMRGQIAANAPSEGSEARVAHDVQEQVARGSARFQRAVPGILPGTLTGDPRGQDHQSRLCAGCTRQDAGHGTLEACAPLPSALRLPVFDPRPCSSEVQDRLQETAEFSVARKKHHATMSASAGAICEK